MKLFSSNIKTMIKKMPAVWDRKKILGIFFFHNISKNLSFITLDDVGVLLNSLKFTLIIFILLILVECSSLLYVCCVCMMMWNWNQSNKIKKKKEEKYKMIASFLKKKKTLQVLQNCSKRESDKNQLNSMAKESRSWDFWLREEREE